MRRWEQAERLCIAGFFLELSASPLRLRKERDELEVGIDTGKQRYLGIGTDCSRCGTKGPGTTFSFSHILFAVYLGVLMWVGLAMRRPELLRVVGLRRAAD